jgi:hypothetical protein
VNFHTLLQSKDFVVVLDKILIPEDEHENEDEYEKYQIRSYAFALRPQPYTYTTMGCLHPLPYALRLSPKPFPVFRIRFA